MLPDGVWNENYSLDDAFDELLLPASTDDADRRELDLLGLAGGLDEPHWWSGGVSVIQGCPRCRRAGQGRGSTWRSTTCAGFGEAEHFD